MSSADTRDKRQKQRTRNQHAKALEKFRPKTIKPVTVYKRENLKPSDVDRLLESDEDE
jgi:hypothetical protein